MTHIEKPATALVLVVDDEPAICWGFEKMLTAEGHEVVSQPSAEAGLAFLHERRPDLIVLDVRLPEEDGISALPKFIEASQGAPVIVMTAFGDLETAVAAVRHGAADYLTKPFGLEQVREVCLRTLAAEYASSATPTESADHNRNASQLVGASPAMQTIFRQIALVAASDLAVLITGETGTGKELVAAAIHQHSPRSDQPYLPVAPVAFNPDLIESELFGHVKGAFTGADRDRVGIFERAEGGTVLLDEIGDLPLSAQVKLLRVLDQHEFFRVGDVTPQHCNVRILAATNCDLEQAVRAGTFREDLYYRLNGLRLQLPPLRERTEDIEQLCNYFLGRIASPNPGQLSPLVLEHLQAQPWFGNIRELRNAVEHAAVVARGRTLRIEDFPPALANPRQQKSSAPGSVEDRLTAAVQEWCERQVHARDAQSEGLHPQLLAVVEPVLFQIALRETQGNRSKAAALLGIHRGTLRERLKGE